MSEPWIDVHLEAAYESSVTGDYDEPAQAGWDYDDEEDA